MTTYSSSTFEEKAESIRQINAWLGKLGIAAAPTRMGYYQRLLEKLASIKDRSESELAKHFASPKLGELLLIFSEVNEWEFIHEHLGGSDSPELAQKIKTATAGPNLPGSENPDRATNAPRNYLFELTIISLLKKCGLPLPNSGLSDAMTIFEGASVVLECKRPQFDHQVNSNMKHGMKRIGERTPDDGFGILAISSSKIATGGDRLIISQTREQIDMAIDQHALMFIRQHSASWNTKAGPSVSGIILHVSAAAVAEGEWKPYTGMKFFFCPIERLATAQADQFRRFCSALGAP